MRSSDFVLSTVIGHGESGSSSDEKTSTNKPNELAIALSSVYGTVLVTLYVVLSFTELVTFPEHMHLLEQHGFFLYLFVLASLFLIYALVLTVGERRTNVRQRVLANHKSHGSLAIRVGAFLFGINTLAYLSLESLDHFEMHSDSPCALPIQGYNVAAVWLFVFLQTALIVMFPRLNLNAHLLIDRLGTMHVLAANVVMWLRTLIKESLHEMTESIRLGHHVQLSKEKLLSTSTLPPWTRSQPTIKHTLTLSTSPSSCSSTTSPSASFSCIACDAHFSCSSSVLDHMQREHNLVIHSVHRLASLELYLKHWRARVLKDPKQDYRDFCTNAKKSRDEVLFTLNDELTQDDLELKLRLQKERLNEVLRISAKERGHDDSFRRECLFCRQVFEHRIHEFVDHLAFEHNLNVGRPTNLVYIKELLDTLDSKLESLVCIYCERIFKSREVLKEHMRKKGHKRIDPNNKKYDKFYLINYIDKDDHFDNDDYDDAECQAWRDHDEEEEEEEESDETPATCLFCHNSYVSMSCLLAHMRSEHEFDFRALCEGLKLDFYAQVKLVNYIRRKVFLSTCIGCDARLANRSELLQHMASNGHFGVDGEHREWDQQQFLFPTYENDVFISMLDDQLFENQQPVVIAEDLPIFNQTTP